MSITRIFAFTLALMFVTAIGATSFTPAAHAAEPVNSIKAKSSSNGGTKPAQPCCNARGR